MDAITALLIDYGFAGMFIASFLAGSVFPFSSEAVMVAMMAGGLDPLGLLIYGSAGNIAGSMFNYWVGHMGRLDWIEKYLHIKPAKLEKAKRFMEGKGAWVGVFAFLPILGSALTVAMGLMRSNVVYSLLSISAGKVVRYIILIYGTSFFI